MSRGAIAQVDLAALRHNLDRVRQVTPRSPVMAMVKANAYGHGLVPVAKALSGADALGVASFDEAMQLRYAGIQTPVVLLSGFHHVSDFIACWRYGFSVVIHHVWQLEALLQSTYLPERNFLEGRTLPWIWLKVDTGMHRLGFEPPDVPAVWQRLSNWLMIQASRGVASQRHSNIANRLNLEGDSTRCTQLGLMTHLADSDNSDPNYTQQQFSCFRELASTVSASTCSVGNSAAILAKRTLPSEWIRPGIMLYGVSPFQNQTGLSHDLKPVMTFKGNVISIKSLKSGDRVGYNGTYHCQAPMTMAVVAVGYGDGYPRHIAAEKTMVLFRGQRCPVIGRVCMDMLMIAIPQTAAVAIGDEVILWGAGLPAEVVATQANTIAYELFTQVTPRVQYQYI